MYPGECQQIVVEQIGQGLGLSVAQVRAETRSDPGEGLFGVATRQNTDASVRMTSQNRRTTFSVGTGQGSVVSEIQPCESNKAVLQAVSVGEDP